MVRKLKRKVKIKVEDEEIEEKEKDSFEEKEEEEEEKYFEDKEEENKEFFEDKENKEFFEDKEKKLVKGNKRGSPTRIAYEIMRLTEKHKDPNLFQIVQYVTSEFEEEDVMEFAIKYKKYGNDQTIRKIAKMLCTIPYELLCIKK